MCVVTMATSTSTAVRSCSRPAPDAQHDRMLIQRHSGLLFVVCHLCEPDEQHVCRGISRRRAGRESPSRKPQQQRRQ
mgnify:CR=1 FL=1